MSTECYERRATFAAPIDRLFAWHEAPGALARLMPPWETAHVAHADGHIEPGARVCVRLHLGPLRLPWDARHTRLERPHLFEDVQERGPFAEWVHAHRFTAVDDSHTELHDDVRYRIRFGALGRLVAGRLVRSKLERMFGYRHRVLARDVARHARTDRVLRVGVSGASGLVGRALCGFLTTGGHEVVRLVRRPARADDEARWDPATGAVDLARLEGLDALVHLAGESIAEHRWTHARKERIASSRIDGTALLADALGRLDAPPGVFVCASGIGVYGPTDGERVVDESAPVDDRTFLGRVAVRWEAAAARVEEHGVRRVSLRLGVVLDPRGGALAKLVPLTLVGAAGPVGGGRQRISWISLDDVLGAIHTALVDPALSGPVNVVAPEPVPQREFMATLARVLRRPAFVPTPAAAVRLALGERAGSLVLDDLAVRPGRLRDAGFSWHDADLEPALRHVLGRVEAP